MQGLAELYRYRFSQSEQAAKEAVWRVLCEHFFQRWIPENAVVLEIACGFGEFIRFVRARRKIAIDLNPDSGTHLSSEIEFHQTDASNMDFLPSAEVDVCFASNFFEHLASKAIMDDVLSEIRRILKPGGRLMALQPNIRYAYARYWDYYDHHLPLSHLSCAEAFAKSSFEIEHLIPRFLPFTTKSAIPKHPVFVKAYLSFPPIWRIVGKQFFIVATKPY